MPSSSSNVSQQALFTLDKLRLFQNYSICIRDSVEEITEKLSHPDCNPGDYKGLRNAFRDNLASLVEEIHFLTEECVLPPCSPQEATVLLAGRDELRAFSRLFSKKIDYLNEMDVLDDEINADLNAISDVEANLERQLDVLARRERELQAQLDQLERE